MINLCYDGSMHIPIDGTLPLHESDILVINDDEYMLKSGNIETDIESYPDAKPTPIGVVTLWDTYNFPGDYNFQGISVDDNYIYAVETNTNKLWIYNKDTFSFVYNFHVGDEEDTPLGISVDDNYIYIIGAIENTVFIYNKDDYTNVDSFLVDYYDDLPNCIAVDDEHIYITGKERGRIYMFEKHFPYRYVYAIIPGIEDEEHIQGVAVDDNYIYMVGMDTEKIWIYPKNIYPFNVDNFSVSSYDINPRGIAVNDDYIYVIGYDPQDANDSKILVFNRNNGVGMKTAKTDSDTDLPIYVRIK